MPSPLKKGATIRPIGGDALNESKHSIDMTEEIDVVNSVIFNDKEFKDQYPSLVALEQYRLDQYLNAKETKQAQANFADSTFGLIKPGYNNFGMESERIFNDKDALSPVSDVARGPLSGNNEKRSTMSYPL